MQIDGKGYWSVLILLLPYSEGQLTLKKDSKSHFQSQCIPNISNDFNEQKVVNCTGIMPDLLENIASIPSLSKEC